MPKVTQSQEIDQAMLKESINLAANQGAIT
jgi:hypothetical protein